MRLWPCSAVFILIYGFHMHRVIHWNRSASLRARDAPPGTACSSLSPFLIRSDTVPPSESHNYWVVLALSRKIGDTLPHTQISRELQTLGVLV
ncbi:hypothetical protein BC834DRAFT_46105 [Gloeopeniophorella convolvens]|nr:hypothetical protein BC834DRAFT_46105 [Gloeopeniophorella convolvens]